MVGWGGLSGVEGGERGRFLQLGCWGVWSGGVGVSEGEVLAENGCWGAGVGGF